MIWQFVQHICTNAFRKNFKLICLLAYLGYINFTLLHNMWDQTSHSQKKRKNYYLFICDPSINNSLVTPLLVVALWIVYLNQGCPKPGAQWNFIRFALTRPVLTFFPTKLPCKSANKSSIFMPDTKLEQRPLFCSHSFKVYKLIDGNLREVSFGGHSFTPYIKLIEIC